MQKDRILEKAQRLGLNINNNLSTDDNLYEMAHNVGISDFKGDSDLNRLENKLDDMIAKETYNESDYSNEELYDDAYNYDNLYDDDLSKELHSKNDNDNREDNQKEDGKREENNGDGSELNKPQQKNKYEKKEKNETLEDNKNSRFRNRLEAAKNKLTGKKEEKEDENKEESDKENDNNAGLGKKGLPNLSNALKDKTKGFAENKKKAISDGIKAYIKKNPKVILIIAIIALVFLLILLIVAAFGGKKNNSDANAGIAGYYDYSCNINSAQVSLKTCDSEETSSMSIEDYVLGVTYYYSKDANYSNEVLKAFMIIVKTNALAIGGFGDTRLLSLNDCSVKYSPNMSDDLKELYNEINNLLYVSSEYEEGIKSFSSSDRLYFDDNTIKELSGSSYESILNSYYSKQRGNINLYPDNFFIGDSRTDGMNTAVSEIDDSNVVAEVSRGYDWFVSTAISSANSKMGDKNYNIFLWLGVNDLGNIDNYISKYKELAGSEWSKHNMLVFPVGPVDDSLSPYAKNSTINDFNSKMQNAIAESNLTNLVYIPITYNIQSYDTAMGVHYGNEDYVTIYNSMISGAQSNDSGSNKTYKLYNYTEYCTYYQTSNSNTLFWWPIGSAQTTTKDGKIFASGEPVRIGVNSYYGMRYLEEEGYTRMHYGTDITGEAGDNVIAARGGTVVGVMNTCKEGNKSSPCGCGNFVDINHGDGIVTTYCHMIEGSVKVKVGEIVEQGQVIGLVGNTGNSYGAHLHFEVILNGEHQTPVVCRITEKVTCRDADGVVRANEGYVDMENPRPIMINTGNYDGAGGKRGVCLALKSMGFSNDSVIALMVNVGHESAYRTNNMEDCYEIGSCCPYKDGSGYYGYCKHPEIGQFGSDEAYTAGVDSGAYPRNNFVHDGAGYGLIQWTSSDRKAGLYDYAKKLNLSIANPTVQYGWLLEEMKGSSSDVYDELIGNNSAFYKSWYVCEYYERPAGDCTDRVNGRIGEATAIVNNGCNE